MLSCCAALVAAEDLGLRVPANFEVSLYADDALAHDIFSMTLDARGRVVVAGAGYVKILHDDDGDGRADRASLFSALPASGAHGMFFDGPDLVCTGDNSVMRQRDVNGDGVADGKPEIWTQLRHPEHGANGLVRGPDGCYYLICGNDAGISDKLITAARSPVMHPRSGGIVRFSPEGKPLDVFAHGFRNPYDLDFDAAGHVLTVDSDGERDHHLPWYAPTRLFDVAQGMEHGWLLAGWARGWNRPQSFFDNVERMVEIGRGSPTGVAAYRHWAFPPHYRGGVFAACWTLGRVYYFSLETAGATCKSKLEIFMETTGDVGFAPCDLAVGPAGELFVAIGGRHTRGSVFCVRYKSPRDEPTGNRRTGNESPLAQVLSADQPLASWSRSRWVPAARKLGRQAFLAAISDERLSADERVRAIEIFVELFGGFNVETAKLAAASNAPAVRARAAWALGCARAGAATQTSSSIGAQILARLTSDANPAVERAAWEAMASDETLDADPDWARGLSHPERRVRAAAIQLARGVGQASYRGFLSKVRIDAANCPLRLAQLWIQLPDTLDALAPPFAPGDMFTCCQALTALAKQPARQLEAVRLLQIGLGDLRIKPGNVEAYAGYLGNATEQVDRATRDTMIRQLAPVFPTSDAELNRELARLLGMLGADEPTLLQAIAGQWSAKSSVEDDIHYLIVASLLTGSRTPGVTSATAECLLSLNKKLDDLGQFPSRNWPFRVGEVFAELVRRDPALAEAIVASPAFGHAEHVLFVEGLPKKLRDQATRKLWAALAGQDREPTPELIALAGRLPEAEARPLLDAQWEHPGLRDSIVLALSRYPQASDRGKFIDSLASPQPDVVEKSANALIALGMDTTAAEMAAALRALKQACGAPKQVEPRRSLLRLLDFWTEGNSDVDEDPDPAKSYLGWFEMFARHYPHESAKLASRSGGDAASWRRRLAGVEWTAGDAARGQGVFERRACNRCHQASGHLGPELKGAVARMSREDLFTSIIDPNLEVSPAFYTTLIATNSGQVYHGVIVYESPESTLLQTGPDTTVRITNAEQSSIRKSTQSLMPTGLLDMLSDQELSDLYAYLRTLGPK
jgi:putative membrane-bound dehydrogenase-like protein